MKAVNRTLIRRIAKMLVCIFLLPHVLTLAVSTVAVAQVEGAQYVAVIDFSNESNFGGQAQARSATDAVVVELMKSDKFSVVTRQQMETAMSELDLAPPLSLAGVMRLADYLAVNAVIVGELRQVEIKESPRQAVVDLQVTMLDPGTGEPMNGAIARGQSTPVETFTGDDDVLVTQAINNAAYLAVKRMQDYIIPEATVLNAVGADEVILNKGAQDGISEGMEMLVYRQGEVIGTIRVREVSNNDSQAVVIRATRGVKPQDKARAIFKVPERVTAGYGEPASKISGGIIGSGTKKSSGSRILSILAGIALIALIAGSHKSGGESVGGEIAAEAGAPPTLATGGGPGVRVAVDPERWDRTNLLQYKIWRDDQTTPIFALAPGAQYYIDRVLQAPLDFTYLEVNPTDKNEEPEEVDGTSPGIQPGTSYTYRVSAIYRRIVAFGEEDTAYSYEETLQEFAGRATPLAPILRSALTSPAANASDVDLADVTFEWRSVLGADSYIVEVSLDPSFREVPFRSSPISWASSSSGDLIVLDNQNVGSFFPGVSPDQTLYWRVGARNSADTPGPIPDQFTGLRYIYSESSQFRPNEEPPPPPGS